MGVATCAKAESEKAATSRENRYFMQGDEERDF
jgi:hypothetical protein